MGPPAGFLTNTNFDDPLDDYQPHRLANASNDATAGGGNAAPLRLRLQSPYGERLIDLSISIDGVNFVAARKKWIRDVIASGKMPGAREEPELQTREAEENPAALATRRRETPSLRDRVRSYLAAAGSGMSESDLASEIEWLLARWEGGPAVTVLSAGRSWERYGVAPLWAMIDADGNGHLTSSEVASAGERLDRADIDESGVIELREVEWRATERRKAAAITRSPLLEIVEPAEGSEGQAAEIVLKVDFQSNQSGPGHVELLATGNEARTTESADVLTILYQTDYLEVSAVALGSRSAADSSNEGEQTRRMTPTAQTSSRDDGPEQFSVGAVADGYPLWRLLDADGDRRLTARERRGLPALLERLDTNQDGSVSADEQPLAIRLAVGRGPLIHRVLGEPTAAASAIIDEEKAPAPDWFLSMDRNGDRELAREEFAGTKTQFEQLDADGNGLLSPTEAGGKSN